LYSTLFVDENGPAMVKVAAFDPEDLLVISAHLEGSRVRASDMVYLPQERRFVLALDRPVAGGASERRQTGLHFERVARAMTSKMPSNAPDAVLSLIGIGFEPVDAPSGHVVLLFEGGSAVRLSVECLEAAMADLVPDGLKE
jgi:hypothetical protein